MTGDEHQPVAQADGDALVAAIARAGGPRLHMVARLGGETGAFAVAGDDGRELVLTMARRAPSGVPHSFDSARDLMEIAAARGVPVPRYEHVIVLADGSVAILQERVAGVPVCDVSPRLLDHVLALAELRRGLLAGTAHDRGPCPLYLGASGPGFCHHEPARTFNLATRAFVARVEAVGAELGDGLSGSDLLHFDYTFGNVLVDPGDPSRVVAVVDWGGARAGDLALDLVMLCFDLSWRAPAIGLDLEQRSWTARRRRCSARRGRTRASVWWTGRSATHRAAWSTGSGWRAAISDEEECTHERKGAGAGVRRERGRARERHTRADGRSDAVRVVEGP